MSRIRVLEQAVAERIAAGEVVERPASVVKELIENSLDAGAALITVEVEQAGLRVIRVSDDGEGMDAADALLAVRRFATSKIASADDLERVGTYGFRGEALPSIAAVSHLELTTRRRGDDSATRVRVVGAAAPEQRPAGIAPGTVLDVRDLFFNTPARRKFLKSPAREFALTVETVQRMALAEPAVAFRLRHDGRDVLTLPATDAAGRLAQVLGDSLARALVAVTGGTAPVTVGGWVVRPEHARPGRGLEYVYVNRRAIRSRLVSRAILQAYAELILVGRRPVAVLALEVDAGVVDVNIHPRKQEVRFADEPRIFSTVQRAVRGALIGPGAIRAVSRAWGAHRRGETEGGLPGGWVPDLLPPSTAFRADGAQGAAVIGEMTPGYVPATSGALPPARVLGQIARTYLVGETADGLILIDQHAAHERVLYERLLAAASRGAAQIQMLAVPVQVEVTAAEAGVLDEFLPAAAAVGFAVEPFGPGTLLIRGVPAVLRSTDSPEALLRRALAALTDSDAGAGAAPQDDTTPITNGDALRRLAIAAACHTAVRAGDVMTALEIAALLEDLGRTEDPYTCFHGRPTMVRLTRRELERWFLRR